ncbi:MAG: hypothetical protein K8R74_03550 [Bacteroidales bacterium]|nr:hypothetical protein [Bacteroidales bacterium]
MGNYKRKGSVVGIAVLLFFAACSVQNNYTTLSLFFDGVPNPEEIRQAALVDSLNAVTADSLDLNAQTATSEFLFHQPYLEKKCADCHDKGRMGSLNQQPMLELCNQCHNDFGTQYNFTHGPAAGGFCTECHNPHKSKEEKLLKRTGQYLCLHCHDADQVFESDFHDSGDETNCINCHNPHGSNNPSLLEKGTCYQCHESFIEKYKVVHGPVAGEHCSVCHVSHHTGTEKMLALTGRFLCFNCHDASQVLASENHDDIEDANCTDCHNPHGGDDRFMFN